MPRAGGQNCEISDGDATAFGKAREGVTTERTKVSYEAARIDAKKLRSLLRSEGKQPIRGKLKAFRGGVEAALTQYITDVANSAITILPSDLRADLDTVEKAAARLAQLLSKREVEDAKVRAVFPQRFADAPLFLGPIAPAIFQKKALEIFEAARSAKAGAHEPKPYVRGGRDKTAVNRLLLALISTWNECLSEKATFGRENASPFIQFAEACLVLVNAKPHSTASLAKQCERLAESGSQQ